MCDDFERHKFLESRERETGELPESRALRQNFRLGFGFSIFWFTFFFFPENLFFFPYQKKSRHRWRSGKADEYFPPSLNLSTASWRDDKVACSLRQGLRQRCNGDSDLERGRVVGIACGDRRGLFSARAFSFRAKGLASDPGALKRHPRVRGPLRGSNAAKPRPPEVSMGTHGKERKGCRARADDLCLSGKVCHRSRHRTRRAEEAG